MWNFQGLLISWNMSSFFLSALLVSFVVSETQFLPRRLSALGPKPLSSGTPVSSPTGWREKVGWGVNEDYNP